MKKTVALIYRLIFVIVSVWSLWSWLGGFSVAAFSDLSVLSDTVNAVVAGAIFLWSIKSAPPEVLLKTKAVFASFAAAVLFMNRSSFFAPADIWWIINILLPFMAVLDWILFDKKGLLKIWDLILWLLAAFGLMAILGFDVDRMLSALLPALAFLGLMLLSGNLFSGKKPKKGLLSLLLEVGFLALECYGFYLLTDVSVEVFVAKLREYTAISNLIAFAVVAVSVIIKLVGFKKVDAYLCRIKGCAVILLIVAFMLYMWILKDAYGGYMARYHLVHSIICPAVLLLDFVCFDSKGHLRWFDPLWWCLPVLAYGVFLLYFPYPVYKDVVWLTFFFFCAISVLCGYVLFGTDKIKEKLT